jgi:phosphoribosylamine--glycine ligase
VQLVVCVPGNGGTAREPKCRNAAPGSGESLEDAACRVAQEEAVDFAVIGPEDPLAAGLAGRLSGAGVPTVGPGKEAARLEASKDFAKQFMQRHGVACASSETFTSCADARKYVEEAKLPVVIKADGLAAGKGVVVAPDRQTALDALSRFMEEDALGAAGKRVVIEEFLSGAEYSVLAAVSVTKGGAENCIVRFLPARDHKRLLTGNAGPNTGGMGAICPLPDVTADTLAEFDRAILKPTLAGLIKDGFEYRGFIFFGVMLTAKGSRLLEYNVRLGDPETQAVLPLMQSDFASLCLAILDGSLNRFPLAWKDGFVCAPVAVSGGYPGKYRTGIPIEMSGAALTREGVKVFVSGGREADGVLVTSGGRVLTATAWAPQPGQARKLAYEALKSIKFADMYFRADIGDY